MMRKVFNGLLRLWVEHGVKSHWKNVLNWQKELCTDAHRKLMKLRIHTYQDAMWFGLNCWPVKWLWLNFKLMWSYEEANCCLKTRNVWLLRQRNPKTVSWLWKVWHQQFDFWVLVSFRTTLDWKGTKMPRPTITWPITWMMTMKVNRKRFWLMRNSWKMTSWRLSPLRMMKMRSLSCSLRIRFQRQFKRMPNSRHTIRPIRTPGDDWVNEWRLEDSGQCPDALTKVRVRKGKVKAKESFRFQVQDHLLSELQTPSAESACKRGIGKTSARRSPMPVAASLLTMPVPVSPRRLSLWRKTMCLMRSRSLPLLMSRTIPPKVHVFMWG